ncbi:protein of unknown function [uncultured Sphingopyxis sp.]|uniref:Uncharacterized protein n=1 Tax=uncultured Sphingopyxis sp. TaxID=310581 RepID=A0A1Y5PPD0_9SPHN|nr:protein of unknown function [uncultured Sphingopyxis sp.]
MLHFYAALDGGCVATAAWCKRLFRITLAQGTNASPAKANETACRFAALFVQRRLLPTAFMNRSVSYVGFSRFAYSFLSARKSGLL